MLTRNHAALLAVLLAAGLSPIALQPAGAGGIDELCDDLIEHPDPDNPATILCQIEKEETWKRPPHKKSTLATQAAVAQPAAIVRRMLNVDATLQPGEPKELGMTRTVWVGFKAEKAARIVIHTFGSEPWDSGVFDPLIAVYRGTVIGNLVRITGNDNELLTGVSNVDSLVQFKTVAGTDYRFQIGSKNQVEGKISLNVFSFPPSGGLSAFLAVVGGNTTNPFNGRDYSCDISSSASLQCESARFIVYNSMDQKLTVTPSTTLGAGVTSIAPFQLAPRTLKVVEFKFGPTFSHTARTQIGNFVFTGRVAGTVVTEATTRAIIVVRPNTRLEDLITSKATPQVQTTDVNVPVTFTSTVTNTGGQNAIGCHFRSVFQSDLNTTFYSVNPANGEQLTPDDVPLNIAAGQSRTFKVLIASQGTRDADFIDPEVVADCANNDRRAFNLRRGFDISASARVEPLPSLSVSSSVPANGVLTVPGSGFAYYTFRAKNTQTTRQLSVGPAYVGPFDDPANSNYPVAICRIDLITSKCRGNYAGSVTYTATKGTVFGFSVRVKAAQVVTPFDPDKRRVYVNFKQTDVPYFHIAAPSIAVKRP